MMILSVAKVKFIKPKLFLAIIPKTSQTKFNKIREAKSYFCSNSSTKMRKNKKEGNFFWVTK